MTAFLTSSESDCERQSSCICDFKRVGLREAIILHVIDIRIAGGAAPALQEADREMLGQKKRELEKEQLRVDVRVLIGVPSVEIVSLASKENVSMIVMPAKGESFVEHILLGSVTENVIRYAHKPVIIHKFAQLREKSKEECDLACKDTFRRILYPTDFSDSAEKVIEYLKEVADADCEEIIIYHVQDTRHLSPHLMDRIDEFNKIDSDRLEKIKGRLEKFGFKKVTIRLETGVSISKILETAEESDVCLIAMGEYGKSRVAEMFLGSVSENVVRRSTKPVLLIHAA